MYTITEMENLKEENLQETGHYLEFSLGKKSFALPLASVERVVKAVEVTLLPKAPEIVRGIINFKGHILPVIDISGRFKLPEREIMPDQHFIIVQSTARSFGLVADTVAGVYREITENIVPPTNIIDGVEFLAGVMKLEQGMMLIPDLEKVLTPDEQKSLKAAVPRKRTRKKHD